MSQSIKVGDDLSYYLGPGATCATAEQCAELRATLKAAKGYLLNAKIDLETGATKKTAINTLEGGLRLIEAALAAQDQPASPVRAESSKQYRDAVDRVNRATDAEINASLRTAK